MSYQLDPRGGLKSRMPHTTIADQETGVLLTEIRDELNRARKKFPGENVTFAALIEEIGEVATALFEQPRASLRKEAVQVAVMAMRLILDGDHTFDAWRAARGLDPILAQDAKAETQKIINAVMAQVSE